MQKSRLLTALSVGHAIEHWYEGAFWLLLALPLSPSASTVCALPVR